MPAYLAQMIHGRTGGEGNHPFEGPENLLSLAPTRVMEYFMQHAIANRALHEHEDYEVYSALRSSDGACVTVMGEFLYTADSRSPFVCMIGPDHATARKAANGG